MELGLILFLTLFFLLYLKPSKQFFKNSLVFPFVILGFIACLIIFSGTSLKSAQYGFHLWMNVVFPSLFPFFVAAELLRNTGIIRAAGIILEPIMRPLFNVPGIGSFAFAMGIFSGYPMGAKITTDLRTSRLCTKAEAERLLTFTNNSSPLFMTGAVAAGIFGKPELGLLLLGTHYLACLTVGILFRFYKFSPRFSKKNGNSPYAGFRGKINGNTKTLWYRMLYELQNSPEFGFGNIGLKLGEAVKNSVNTLLMIGGFIVLFCIIINFLLSLKIIFLLASGIKSIFSFIGITFSLASSLISGIFEMTTGINYIKISLSPLSHKIIIASSILGWGGLSVHAQTAGIISKTDISIKPYLVGKFLQGLFAGIYTAVFLNISGMYKEELPVMNYLNNEIGFEWSGYSIPLIETVLILGVVTAFILLVSKGIHRYLNS